MKVSHLNIVPIFAAASIEIAAVVAGTPQDPAIDVAAFKSDTMLNALFTDLGTAIDKPASDIQKHTLNALTTPEMNALINKTKAGWSLKTDYEAQDTLDKVFMADMEASLPKEEVGKDDRLGGADKVNGKRSAAEDCVQNCVSIKTQSCELLKGTHLSEKSCTKKAVEKECAESCRP